MTEAHRGALLRRGGLHGAAVPPAPGWTTASVRAFTLMHFGVYRDLAVLALASVGCILFPWLLLVCLLKRRFVRSRAGL